MSLEVNTREEIPQVVRDGGPVVPRPGFSFPDDPLHRADQADPRVLELRQHARHVRVGPDDVIVRVRKDPRLAPRVALLQLAALVTVGAGDGDDEDLLLFPAWCVLCLPLVHLEEPGDLGLEVLLFVSTDGRDDDLVHVVVEDTFDCVFEVRTPAGDGGDHDCDVGLLIEIARVGSACALHGRGVVGSEVDDDFAELEDDQEPEPVEVRILVDEPPDDPDGFESDIGDLEMIERYVDEEECADGGRDGREKPDLIVDNTCAECPPDDWILTEMSEPFPLYCGSGIGRWDVVAEECEDGMDDDADGDKDTEDFKRVSDRK